MFTLKDFSYDLPPELIAQEPARPRDSARLMVINRVTGKISHHHVYDLPALLDSSWGIVANNTKVFPARLYGHKITGGKVEILLLKPLGNSRYVCISKPGLKAGTELMFDANLVGTVLPSKEGEEREITILFNQPEDLLRTIIAKIGSMPTPPYIKKMLEDVNDYQTIYAKYGFSAAAPTAGLHFTPELLTDIQLTHPWFEVTLDVGLGTFLPVQVEDVTSHHMHQENFTINTETADAINDWKKNRKLLAIGTTTTRALESSLNQKGEIITQSKSTDIFIYPPHHFQSIDGLMTNFHLPESTLLMMVSAFASTPNTDREFTTFGESLIGKAYKIAVAEKYRFFSFGDAMLIV